MLKQSALSVAILIVTEASAQLSPIDLLADAEFRLDWGAYAGDKAELSIEMCPRGTCDFFVSQNPNLESFLMFVDSYIVFASDYGDLKNLNSRDDGRIAPIPYIGKRLADIDVSEVVTPICGVTLTLETISCSLNDLAESLDIQMFFVRYDEGQRNVVEQVDWRTQKLSAAEIAKSLSWYADMGLRIPDLDVTPGAPRYWERVDRFCCSERFRQFMRERVVESGLPGVLDIALNVVRGQELHVSEAYRIEPTRLEELPCWENRSCDYPVYEGTARLNASTSASTGELTRFELNIGDATVAPDLVDRFGRMGVFNLEGAKISHEAKYLPMELWSDTMRPTPTVSVTGLSVSDPWCESGIRRITVYVTFGFPGGGRGVDSACSDSRTDTVGSHD
jgi:hypothetical protein